MFCVGYFGACKLKGGELSEDSPIFLILNYPIG